MPRKTRQSKAAPEKVGADSLDLKPMGDLQPMDPQPAREHPSGTATLVLDQAHLETVVHQGMLSARVSLAIATADFKAMLIPPPSRARGRARSIIVLFRELAEKGVEIRLLHAGVPSSAALRELRQELPERITIRRCPRLHAKMVVADSRWMYLGSANLTGAGLGAKSPRRRNFEMGLATTSASLIDAAMQQFNGLWEGCHCPTCGRRNVCPVPLEEPDLSPRD